MTHFFTHRGLPILFAVVLIESLGIPLPGETALIAFGVLAAQGHYSIESVIAIAAAGAIVGDNLGYRLIGRLGGWALFRRWGWLNQYSDRVLPHAESLMARHGGKTVFFDRFVSFLRYTVAWVAGLSRMPWWRFLFLERRGGHRLGDGGRIGLVLRRPSSGKRDPALQPLRGRRRHRCGHRRLARRALCTRASRKTTLNRSDQCLPGA
jgi:membrane protein YqaA with SNARE-associated domain